MSFTELSAISLSALFGFGLARIISSVQWANLLRGHVWLALLIISISYAIINIIITYEIQGSSDGRWYYDTGEHLRSAIISDPKLIISWIFNPIDYVAKYPELGVSLGEPLGGLGMRVIISICAATSWLSFGSYYLLQVYWSIAVVAVMYRFLRNTRVWVWILGFPSVGFFCSGVSRESLLLVAGALIVWTYSKHRVKSREWYLALIVAFCITFLVRYEIAVIIGMSWLLSLVCYAIYRRSTRKSALLALGLIVIGLSIDEILINGQFRMYLETKRVNFLKPGEGSNLDPLTTWGSNSLVVVTGNLFTSFFSSLQPLLWIETWSIKYVAAATWVWTELFLLYKALNYQVRLLPPTLTSTWIIVSFVTVLIIMGSFVMNSGALLRYRASHIVLFSFLVNVTSLACSERSRGV